MGHIAPVEPPFKHTKNLPLSQFDQILHLAQIRHPTQYPLKTRLENLGTFLSLEVFTSEKMIFKISISNCLFWIQYFPYWKLNIIRWKLKFVDPFVRNNLRFRTVCQVFHSVDKEKISEVAFANCASHTIKDYMHNFHSIVDIKE